MAGYYPPESFYPPAKRMRPNPPTTPSTQTPPSPSPSTSTPTPPTPPRSITPIEAAVLSLPPATLKAILLLSAQSHPDIASHLYTAHNELILAESQAVQTFTHLVQAAWHALNPRYRGSSTRQVESAGEVVGEVREVVAEIGNAGMAGSFGTRRNAVLALVEVGEQIRGAEDVLGVEVRMRDCGVGEAIGEVLRGLNGDERESVAEEVGERVRGLASEVLGIDELLGLLGEDEGVRIGVEVPTVVTDHHH